MISSPVIHVWDNDIQKIITEVVTCKYTKVRVSMKTNDGLINNTKHLEKSPKVTFSITAESFKATNFYDKERDNKCMSEAINCNFPNINHLPTTVNVIRNITNSLK